MRAEEAVGVISNAALEVEEVSATHSRKVSATEETVADSLTKVEEATEISAVMVVDLAHARAVSAMPSKRVSVIAETVADSLTKVEETGDSGETLTTSRISILDATPRYAMLSRRVNAIAVTTASFLTMVETVVDTTAVLADLLACAMLSKRVSVIVETVADTVMI